MDSGKRKEGACMRKSHNFILNLSFSIFQKPFIFNYQCFMPLPNLIPCLWFYNAPFQPLHCLPKFPFQGNSFRASALWSQEKVHDSLACHLLFVSNWKSYKIISLHIKCVDSYEMIYMPSVHYTKQETICFLIIGKWILHIEK